MWLIFKEVSLKYIKNRYVLCIVVAEICINLYSNSVPHEARRGLGFAIFSLLDSLTLFLIVVTMSVLFSVSLLRRLKDHPIARAVVISCVSLWLSAIVSGTLAVFSSAVDLGKNESSKNIRSIKKSLKEIHTDEAEDIKQDLMKTQSEVLNLVLVKAFIDYFYPLALASITIPPIFILFTNAKAKPTSAKKERRKKIDFD